MITKTFEEILLNSAFRGDDSGLPETYYLGLCSNLNVSREMTMAQINEISGDGYQRLAAPKTAIGWNEVEEQSDCLSIRSQQVTFNPTGNWTAFNRMFLCDAASGSECNLLAVSTPLPNEVSLEADQTYPVAFEFYLK